VLFLLSHAVLANESTWPQLLDGDPKSGICGEALAVATSLYQSEHFYLYALADLQTANISSTFALRQAQLDVSSGDALVADQSIFQKIPRVKGEYSASRSIYWQIKPSHGRRFVMYEEGFGWRGDQYTLFSIDENISPSEFFEGSGRDIAKRMFQPVIDETWRPPLMMREMSDGEIWAIDVGPPYVVFSDWNIYSNGADGAKKRCTVRFRDRSELGSALLPKPVRRLAVLLDQSLDNKKNEGTLNYTARQRLYVRYLWTNIATRPQAFVKEDPDISRAKADTEFAKWSEGTSRFRKLRRQILAQFPQAQRTLANYYKASFRKGDQEANAMAQQALDIVFRTYFTGPAG
jgi:hypothetical protein